MKNAYIKTLESIDLLILMTEISNKDFNYEESILKLNSISNTKVFVVINKIDLCENYRSDEARVHESFLEKHKKSFLRIGMASLCGFKHVVKQVFKQMVKQVFFIFRTCQCNISKLIKICVLEPWAYLERLLLNNCVYFAA